MRVSVFGLGYVGCVSAACLARDGHTVIGVDVDAHKVAAAAAGRSPVLERGLDELIRQAVAAGRLRTTDNGRLAVLESDISLICVGTPSNGNGSLNLEFVDRVCIEIGTALAEKAGYHVVVVRSTVLPETIEGRLIPILEEHSGRTAGLDFGACMNPEFLREGSAIEDYDHPCHVVLGELDARSGDAAESLYRAIKAPIVRTTIRTAEMLKYANNAFHALKVAFGNEIGNLCGAHGVSGQEVMELLCQDRRQNISPAYLRPGFAFGGSCLPKDLRALVYRAKIRDVECPVLNATLSSNQKQIRGAVERVERTRKKKIGILGLSFKAGTDDVRESPVVLLTEALVGKGHQVRIFDENVKLTQLTGANRSYLERELPHIANLMCESLEQVLAASEVVVIGNGSPAFRVVPALLRKSQIVIDLVGITHDAHRVAESSRRKESTHYESVSR